MSEEGMEIFLSVMMLESLLAQAGSLLIVIAMGISICVFHKELNETGKKILSILFKVTVGSIFVGVLGIVSSFFVK